MTEAAVSIRCDDVRFRYAPGAAEMRFDCAFQAGEMTALVGPSGSGKSTLVSLIAGFETPHAGAIRFGDRDMTRVPVSERPVSMVFQDNNLFAHLRVFENVALGVSPSLRLTAQDRATVEAALEAVGLAGYGARRPAELSGGERQRVALARVIVRRKPVLLLDEAFASLGPALRVEMLDLLASIHEDRAMTTIMVTHFPEDARRIAARTVFLADGATMAEGPTDTLLDPDVAPEAVRAYLGQSDRRPA
ncbi:thiamine ABC transporter ATP-binding protein [Oricola sp.]|uniref:thiamine ABC transporter ATP-binding protein n=1 Tax=Oricola sp. TaxID=1979950 RepID=UPI0025D4D895|nr:thiamine ABC transporter ATP-binding protein [Oricola sp.]MCI5075147.1 thiamine ABC transporter ATP-binding protein [Oricola sp.]